MFPILFCFSKYFFDGSGVVSSGKLNEWLKIALRKEVFGKLLNARLVTLIILFIVVCISLCGIYKLLWTLNTNKNVQWCLT